MVVSSMANSVLQLWSRCGVCAADGRTMATPVPSAVSMHVAAVTPLLALGLGVVLQLCAAQRCMAATEAHSSATATSGGDGAPDDATALGAYLAARAWLDADRLPALDAAEAKVDLEGVSGVCVVLRLDGRFVGAGDDASGDALMLRRAVGQAVAKALGDETIRSVRNAAGDKVTVRLSLEVELAGPLVPLLGRTIAEASARVVPGRDGLAVRRGEQVVRAYPSRLAVADIADRPGGTITALLVDAGLPAKDLNEYATDERVGLARFATTRLRADGPRTAPSAVVRGGRTIELAEVTPQFIDALAVKLVARLSGQVDTAAAGARLRGTLNPTLDTYDPPHATPRQAALAALALARAGASASLPEPIRAGARDAARRLVVGIAALPDGERAAPVDALCALAAVECGLDDAAMRKSLAARARADFDAQVAAGESASPVAGAFAAAALAATDAERGPAQATEYARGLMARAGARPGILLQAALPLALLSRNGAIDPARAGEIRAALSKLGEQLAPLQVGADVEADGQQTDLPLDLVGGLQPPSGPRYRIDSEALIHFAALSLARADGLPAMERRAVRFLAQHTADDPWAGAFRNPERLRGLVRASLAGDDCPPDPLVFGVLLAVSAAENG